MASRLRYSRTVNGKRTPTYNSWRSMWERCTRTSNGRWEDYGGRGIKVCDRWKDFDVFVDDMGFRPAGKTLDRREVDGHYEPDNCRWATQEEQDNNRRHCTQYAFRGKQLTLAQIADLVGMAYTTLRGRVVYLGWSLEDATNPTLRPCGRNQQHRNPQRSQ